MVFIYQKYNTLIGRAMLTFNVRPNSSASSILSLAAAASATSSNSTKANPLCASVSKSSGIVMSENITHSLAYGDHFVVIEFNNKFHRDK